MTYLIKLYIGCLVVFFGWIVLVAPSRVAAACEPLPSDKGQAIGTIDIATPGQYTLWLRMYAPDADHDSVLAQVDDHCPSIAGGVASADGFVWVNASDAAQPFTFDLSEGQHFFRFAGRDAGAGIDRVLLISDASCVPTGADGQCAEKPQPSAFKEVQLLELNKSVVPNIRGILIWLLCAVCMVAAFIFLLWKYRTFIKKQVAVPGASTDLIVVSGLPHTANFATRLMHFFRHHKLVVLICGGIIIASLITGMVVAATPNPGFEAETASLSNGAKVVENAAASAGKLVLFETPVVAKVTPPPSSGGSTGGGQSGGGDSGGGGGDNNDGGGGGDTGNGFPDATNTGPVGCSSYTPYSGTLDITTDGTVLNCIQLNGTLSINADNVTVQNSILNGDSWWGVRVGNTNATATNFKLLHNKLQTVPGQGPDSGGYDYGISQESSGYMEIGYNDISGYKDGVTTSNGYIHDNYIHNLSQFVGAHTQDIYVYSGPAQVKIEHNTLINDSPQDQATAAVYIAPDSGHQNDRTVANNLMAGGAFTIYGGDSTATNIVIVNNKFSTQIYPNSGYYGWAAYWFGNNSGNLWSNNTWIDGPNIGQAFLP